MPKLDKNFDRGPLSALANKARLSIVFALLNGEKNVSELVETLGLEQTLVSHGLKRLASQGYVKMRRQGNFHYYSLNKKFALPILHAIDPTLKKGRKK